MTLGNAATAHVRLIVWCKKCQHQIEPDPAEHAQRYGAEMPVPEWRERLVCSGCGSRDVDMVPGRQVHLGRSRRLLHLAPAEMTFVANSSRCVCAHRGGSPGGIAQQHPRTYGQSPTAAGEGTVRRGHSRIRDGDCSQS
jgi:hypothetical protein